MSEFRVRALLATYTEIDLECGSSTGSGNAISFKHAFNAELAAFGQLWADTQVTLKEWLKTVQDLGTLPAKELERLRCQVEPFSR
jgi:hypothetical protein